MTMAEWDNKRQYTNADGVLLTVVMVKEHKTSVAGCCKCVLTTVDVDRVNVYIRSVRPQQIEDHDHPFVLALVGGKQYDKFTQRAKYVFKKLGLKSITPTRARKVAATTAATSVVQEDSALAARHLAHSTQTDSNYYQTISNPQYSVKAYTALTRSTQRSEEESSEESDSTSDFAEPAKKKAERKSPPPPPPSPPPQTSDSAEDFVAPKTKKTKTTPTFLESTKTTRRKYTDDETETISLYFDSYIDSNSTPSLLTCGQFLQDHNLDRNKKNIQDKVKNIIKYKNN